jgi:hypothetical protein
MRVIDMTYFEKLKDPRWQKKRLEKLEEQGFECDNCGNDKEELTVHHRHYKKNTDPWDYDNNDLAVFCKTCHKSWHDAKEELNEIIGTITSCEQIQRIAGYALAISNDDIFPVQLSSNYHITGYSDAFRTTPTAIEYLMSEAEKERYPISTGVVLSRQMVD